MRTIYKFSLQSYITKLTLQDPKFLHVGVQYGEPQVWVEIDPDSAHSQEYYIQAVGTGHIVPEGGQYLGTLIVENDTIVLHFYAVLKE